MNEFDKMLSFTKQCEAVSKLEKAALELWELTTSSSSKEPERKDKITIHKDGISIIIQTVKQALTEAEARNRGYDRSTTSRTGITSNQNEGDK